MRRLVLASLSLVVALSAFAAASFTDPAPATAAGCIRFVATNFNAPGDDNLNPNGEWVRIKNVCATRKGLSGWTIHDYGRNHTYTFPSGVAIGPDKTITLYTGKGSATTSKRYWGKSAAVWNNAPPEYAYLRKPDGTLMSKRTEY